MLILGKYTDARYQFRGDYDLSKKKLVDFTENNYIHTKREHIAKY